MATAVRDPRQRVEDAARDLLTGLGFDEAITVSFVADDLVGPLEDEGNAPPIRVEHSVRRHANALRQSLVPSLLAARRHNEARGNAEADLFEVAHVYLPRPRLPLPDEPTRLAIVAGRDFFGLKGVVEALLARFHLEARLAIRAHPVAWFTPGRSAALTLDGGPFGWIGEVARSRLDALELREPCSAVELDLGTLIDRADLVPQDRPLPPFPGWPATCRWSSRPRCPGATWPARWAGREGRPWSRSSTSTPSGAAISPKDARASTSASGSATPSGP